MAGSGERTNRTVKWLRWVARVWSLFVIGITLVVVIAHAVVPEPGATDYPPIENLLPLLMCLSVVGLGVAWRWERWGGALNVGLFLAMLGLYWAIRRKFMPARAVAILSLAVVPGILFLVCAWRTRKPGAVQTGSL